MNVTPNQMVAWNLRVLRQVRGLSQAEVREQMRPFGYSWSKASYSAAETSYQRTDRPRCFDANLICALSQVFDVPVTAFFRPPEYETKAA